MCLFPYMGIMTQETSEKDDGISKTLSAHIRRVDEDRWLSSRYAPKQSRHALIALYALNYELAKVRTTVSEDMLGAIRFQWWREALEEIETGKPAREHEVVSALRIPIQDGQLKILALQKLVDGHEAAFETQDRTKEPEAWLMAVAANILASHHGWGQAIREVAPYYAAARRGESKAHGPILPPAPSAIRPAVAHLRLRRLYADGKKAGHLRKRLSVLRAIRSGEV